MTKKRAYGKEFLAFSLDAVEQIVLDTSPAS